MGNFFEHLPEFIEKYSKAPTKGQLRLAREFLDIAHQDLKSSRVLYDAGIYNMAAYHLQQSVEKASKAFYVILGVLDYKEIRKTSHDAPELFFKMVEIPGIAEFAEFTKDVSGTEMVTDTSEARSVLSTKSKRVEIARLNAVQIDNWLSVIPKVEIQISPLSTLMGADIIEFYIMTALRLYILSSMTFPHEQGTHYPDCIVKPKEYTLNLGIIANISKVWNETEIATSRIQQFIDSAKSKK